MKNIYTSTLAALCIMLALSGCEKDVPLSSSENHGLNTPAYDLPTGALKPHYVYTLAGNPDNFNHNDGIRDQAGFMSIQQLLVKDGFLYALDSYIIRKIRISDGTVTTLAGDPLGGASRDGLKDLATFELPTSMAFGPDGNIYVAEYLKVRKVTMDGMVTTVAGTTFGYQDGPAKTAKFARLSSIGVCTDGTIFVFDNGINQIRRISPSGKVSTLTSGGPSGAGASNWSFSSISINEKSEIYVGGAGIYRLSDKGKLTAIKKTTSVIGNGILALNDGSLFVSTNNQIQKLSASGNLAPFAGLPETDSFNRPAEGPADSVDLLTPNGFAIENNILYFAAHPDFMGDPGFPSQQGHVIQMISLAKE